MDEQRWERMERTMEFILDQQARSEAQFSERHDKAQVRLDRTQAQLDEVVRVQIGQQSVIDSAFALIEALGKEFRQSQRELQEAQRHTEDRLNALIDYVDRSTPRTPPA